TGFMIYQDLIYKSLALPVSITTRFALFDTDDYDSRIYTYENDLLYQFAVPALYYKGLRYYINLRYTGIRNLSIECRWAHTQYFNEGIVIGTGLDEIQGRQRNDFKVQLKYSFGGK
ncbi:MAG: helix-hairpin-helix domain-containing protein, partial [Saprospiraceae bacterium]|nr:helix-hairpin-helix domain-containing protein [Saprospiraceae bacterium]